MGIRWATRHDNRYMLLMRDGYLATDVTEEMEKQIARRLYRLARGMHLSAEQLARGPPRPDPVHVWVIGRDGWTSTANSPIFSGIHEAEQDPKYRIVIAGLGTEHLNYHCGGNWSSWVRLAGLRRVKAHPTPAEYYRRCDAILGPLFEHYAATRRPGSQIIEECGVPFRFFGDGAEGSTAVRPT